MVLPAAIYNFTNSLNQNDICVAPCVRDFSRDVVYSDTSADVRTHTHTDKSIVSKVGRKGQGKARCADLRWASRRREFLLYANYNYGSNFREGCLFNININALLLLSRGEDNNQRTNTATATSL